MRVKQIYSTYFCAIIFLCRRIKDFYRPDEYVSQLRRVSNVLFTKPHEQISNRSLPKMRDTSRFVNIGALRYLRQAQTRNIIERSTCGI